MQIVCLKRSIKINQLKKNILKRVSNAKTHNKYRNFQEIVWLLSE